MVIRTEKREQRGSMLIAVSPQMGNIFSIKEALQEPTKLDSDGEMVTDKLSVMAE
jgi:hypothetical protein